MSDEHKKALIAFHSSTGNDNVSSFFCKSKNHYWQVLEKNDMFLCVFSRLGAEWSTDDDLLSKLAEYVCNIFGTKKKEVNAVRYEVLKNLERRERFKIFAASMSTIVVFALPVIKLHRKV